MCVCRSSETRPAVVGCLLWVHSFTPTLTEMAYLKNLRDFHLRCAQRGIEESGLRHVPTVAQSEL